jgi:uncharacterized protein
MEPSLHSRNALHASAPFHIIAKPIGPICNLACDYCFYLEKEQLYRKPDATRTHRESFRMSDAVLERFVEQYISAQPTSCRELQFAWQGGEPTLMGIPFFERVIELQKKHARSGLAIHNALQTNATTLDDSWCHFLKRHDFLVGVSLDGPRATHDAHRLDRQGGGSFDSVITGIEALQRHDVDFNTLSAIHHDSCSDPAGLYDFLKETGSTYLQFIPIVEHTQILHAKAGAQQLGALQEYRGAEVSRRSVTPRAWGDFLVGIFERWVECDDVGSVFVQIIENAFAVTFGHPSTLCVNAVECGDALALEHNGDIYSCDHYVSPEYALGNITSTPLVEIVDADEQRAFGRSKRSSLPGACLRCPHLDLCGGGCPKDRILVTRDGEPGLCYLCEGYKAFFRSSLPVLREIAECVRLGYPARDYRRLPELRAQHTLVSPRTPDGTRTSRIGRNAPCPCGSGQKFKTCCGV